MKTGRRFIVLFAVLFVSFFSLSQDARADCDPGWVGYSVSGNWKGCEYTIYYCVMTDPMGITHVEIDLIMARIDCADVLLHDMEFWAAVPIMVKDDAIENATFSPCPLSSYYNFEINRAKCWKVVNDPHSQTCSFVTCETIGKCIWRYKVCTDYSQTPPANIVTLVAVQSVNSEMCLATWPLLPPSGTDWDDEWESECFVISCEDE